MFDFFLWNLPLFIDRRVLKFKIECQFPGSIVDIFGPSKTNHSSHGGCARLLTSKNLNFGEKTPIDLGFRFPLYGKESVPKVNVKLSKARRNVLKNGFAGSYAQAASSCDEISDEKSYEHESSLSITLCETFNIVDFSIVCGPSLDIVPEVGKLDGCPAVIVPSIAPVLPALLDLTLGSGIDILPVPDDTHIDFEDLDSIDIASHCSCQDFDDYRIVLCVLFRLLQMNEDDEVACGINLKDLLVQFKCVTANLRRLGKTFTLQDDGSCYFHGCGFDSGGRKCFVLADEKHYSPTTIKNHAI